jgi:ABC-type cobalamin/Fe3+-siderophores transport system ATPase subunit
MSKPAEHRHSENGTAQQRSEHGGRLEATGIAAGYGEHAVLSDVSMLLPAGKITALVGPNGSGKSTLLRVIARLMKQRDGVVLLDGVDLADLSGREVALKIASLRQSGETPPGVTVEELVALGRFPHRGPFGTSRAEDGEVVEWAIDATNLQPLRKRMVETLSGGERQRAWIAMALAQRTGVLLLDEPTTFLDIRAQVDVLGLVRDLSVTHGITVGWVLHDLNVAVAYSDQVVALSKGRIVAQGPPAEVVDPQLVAEVFGVEVSVLADPRTGLPFCITHGAVGSSPAPMPNLKEVADVPLS